MRSKELITGGVLNIRESIVFILPHTVKIF